MPKPEIVSDRNRKIYHGIEGTTESWEAHELVYVASGAVEPCATNPALILGLVTAAASGTTGAACTVEIIEPGDEIAIDVTNNGTDALVSTLTAMTGYPLYTASNEWYIDSNGSTDRCQFIRSAVPLRESLAAGSIYRAIITIKSTVLQWNIGE